jgi:hypothetical protein
MLMNMKTWIQDKGKIVKVRLISVLADHEARITALEEGNSSEPSPEPTLRDLSFTINDGTDPIKGATVAIGAKTGTTGDAGGCTIKDVAEGSVSVEVSAEGYTTKTETITVDETHTAFTISLVAVSSP